MGRMEICDSVENACLHNYSNLNDKDDVTNGNSRLVLFLNIADYINIQRGEGDSARNAVFTIAKLISSSNVNQMVKLNAIKLLDLLVKNCGYPVHLHISRKGFLQVINHQFPPIIQATVTECNNNDHNDLSNNMTSSNKYSIVQTELLKELNIWYHTICRWTSYKNDLVYIKHLYNMILDKGYLYPPLSDKDLAILKPYSYIDDNDNDNLVNSTNNMVMSIRSFEEFNNEQTILLNSQITELRRRGKEKDIKASNILVKKLQKFKSNNITNAGKDEIMIRAENWNHVLLKWNQKLDKLLLKDDPQSGHQLTGVEDNKLHHFIDCLKQEQKTVQAMLMEDINDETFINKLFMFNDNTVCFLQRIQSYREELLKKIDGENHNEIEINFERNLSLSSLDDNLIGNAKEGSNNNRQKMENKDVKTDKLKKIDIERSIKEKSKSIDPEKRFFIDNNDKNANECSVEVPKEKERINNSYNGSICSLTGNDVTNNKDGKTLNVKIISEEKGKGSEETFKNDFDEQKESNLDMKGKLNVQRTHLGLMFKTKSSNTAPVLTYAVSKAETNGQFKFDGNTNEITTHFKPFLDNP